MSLSTVYYISFILAGLDAFIALACALHGDVRCVMFAALAGFMWAHGMYYKDKAQKENV